MTPSRWLTMAVALATSFLGRPAGPAGAAPLDRGRIGVAAILVTAVALRPPRGEPPVAATQPEVAPPPPALPEESVVQALSPRLLERELEALATGTRDAITFLHTRVAPQVGSAD